jgi:uncharacterized protein YneF (UPF0154 family)
MEFLVVGIIVVLAAGIGVWIGMLVARRLARRPAEPEPEEARDEPDAG